MNFSPEKSGDCYEHSGIQGMFLEVPGFEDILHTMTLDFQGVSVHTTSLDFQHSCYTLLPDWKLCRMRGRSLLHPNLLRGCICVTKQ